MSRRAPGNDVPESEDWMDDLGTKMARKGHQDTARTTNKERQGRSAYDELRDEEKREAAVARVAKRAARPGFHARRSRSSAPSAGPSSSSLPWRP